MVIFKIWPAAGAFFRLQAKSGGRMILRVKLWFAIIGTVQHLENTLPNPFRIFWTLRLVETT